MQKNRLWITRGDGELVLARTHSTWLVTVAMCYDPQWWHGHVLLMVYWTWRCDLHGRLVTDMEKLDGIVQEVNTTCKYIAHSCLEPMHSLTATQCPILSARVRLKC